MSIYEINSYATLSKTVNDMSLMVGMGKQADPAGSQDPAVQQMVAAANMAGADMLNLYDWQKMAKPFEIEIKAEYPGQKEIAVDLPKDFWCFIDQTQWNKNTQLPALGPISPQAWQQIMIRNPKIVMTFLWQVRDDKLWIQCPPDSPQVFSFYYMSRGWVRDADNPDLYKNQATKNGDLILFDDYLMVLLARVKWLQMKGMDSTSAAGQFQTNYEMRKGKAKGAPVLSLVSNVGLPYLNVLSNVPDTGYGNMASGG